MGFGIKMTPFFYIIGIKMTPKFDDSGINMGIILIYLYNYALFIVLNTFDISNRYKDGSLFQCF